MKTGQLVSFTVPAYPGQTFKAPIERISREVDEKSRTMPVELIIQEYDGRLSPGSFTNVSWPHPTVSSAFLFPDSGNDRSTAHLRHSSAQWQGGLGNGSDRSDRRR